MIYALSALAVILAVSIGVAAAADAPEPQEVTVALSAGQTYVIRGLKPSSTPAVKILANPNALIVTSSSPGTITLLGAARGKWDIEAETASGAPAIYHVIVSAAADSSQPLRPGSSAAARALDEGSDTTALDKGAGPITTSGEVGSPDSAPAQAALQESAAAGLAPRDSQVPPALDSAMGMAATPASPDNSLRAVIPSPSPAAPGPAPVPKLADQTARIRQHLRTDPSATSFSDFARSGGPHAGANYLPAGEIELMADTSEIFDFPRRLKRVSIADSKIADIEVISPYQLNLIGHKQGFTTLVVWNDQGHYQERRIRVDSTGQEQVLLSVVVAELNRSRMESQGINISAALSHYGVSLVGLPGAVATPYTPQSGAGSSSGSGGASQSSGAAGLPLGGSLIPLLLSPTITYGLAAQNSNVLTQTLFQYLETHQLGKVLAEPHLLANSGQQAKFLSGGEIPIVISQALNSTIVFKQFGTSVTFVPTVIGPDTIDLKVRPEVSEPDYSHGVELFGFTVPAFVTRRADTDVRLRNGQTLIIAGLILTNKQSTVNKVPYLGDIPYMGALFRTTGYSSDTSDLVMSVTPRIVQPLPYGAAPADPTNVGPLTPAEIRTHALRVYDASRPRF